MKQFFSQSFRAVLVMGALVLFAGLMSATKLSAAGRNANCYIVSKAGTYSFPTVKGNSDVSVGNVAKAEVLWESYGTSEMPSVGSLISSVSYSNGTITFSTPSTLKNGNAVIAAKDAAGNILWSWHIWVCKGYNPASTSQTYYNGAGRMMDRNLGATSAEPGDVESLGLLYQWGRKDPFLGSSSISYNTRASSTASWPASESSSSRTNVQYTISHPMTFIYGVSSSHWDWLFSSRDDKLWGASKTKYDPCPPGWRVPDGGPDGVWSKALEEKPVWDDNKKGMDFKGKFGDAKNPIWYPAAGYLNYFDGSLFDVGYSGYWWSCTPTGSSSLDLSSHGDVYPSVGSLRAGGFSVRCAQE